MNTIDLQSETKEQILDFIRQRLSFSDYIQSNLRYTDKEHFSKEHKRFDMSGYEEDTGECTKQNLSVLNTFADLGIYDYTSYLVVDFYKGVGTIYLKYFGDDENHEWEMGGYGTTEIIYKIFEITIFSEKCKRRRS